MIGRRGQIEPVRQIIADALTIVAGSRAVRTASALAVVSSVAVLAVAGRNAVQRTAIVCSARAKDTLFSNRPIDSVAGARKGVSFCRERIAVVATGRWPEAFAFDVWTPVLFANGTVLLSNKTRLNDR